MKNEIIQWIKNWFDNESGNAKGIVINVSGGVDSTLVAKLCVDAIGKDKVFGILQPNGEQKDISDSIRVCELLGIDNMTINIKPIYDIISQVANLTDETKINIAPRIRMTNAYSIAQTKHYRVVGTGNLSERTIGYFTKWGDGACDFNPIANLTKRKVIALGDELGLPYDLVHKVPADGLSGASDEDRFGFTYEQLDDCIEGNFHMHIPKEIKEKIQKMKKDSEHKRCPIPRPIIYGCIEYDFIGNC